MKYLLEIADAIARKKGDVEIRKIAGDHKAEIDEEVTNLSDEEIAKILSRLFSPEIPVSNEFYDSIREFQHQLGYGSAFYSVGGRIWARGYSKVERNRRKALLDLLLDDVWRAIFYLPEFCSQVEIEAQFAGGWFYRFGVKVKDDMANWDFFDGVKNYACHFPASGMKVFETYMEEQLDELKISLAALLLGTVRSQAVRGHYEKTNIDKWDQRLISSSQIEMRLTYHRSLPVSFDMGSLSMQELDCKLTRMLNGEPAEVSEAFLVVWRCLRSENTDASFVQFARTWFSKNASSELPDAAKYHLVNAMWFFSTPGKQKEDTKASEADDLLVKIQPIEESNLGTWKYLEMYLTERLRQDPESFGNILGRFVDANSKGMVAQFQSEGFDHLKLEICQAEVQHFVTGWSLSTNTNKREIARAILQKSESVVFSENVLSETSEEQLEIALQEFTRRPLLAEKASPYLLALEPAFENVRPELKQKFKNEMILQAINYPGACLGNWKRIKNPSELLKEVISNAEKYFERLNTIKDSPAISFTFPGCKEAADREASEFSNKVSREAMEKSVFAKLAKHMQIIYGSRWSVMAAGKLGQATNFSEFSHSMEFPRLEIIDPEGMAIRRLQAASVIEEAESGK